GGRAHTHGGKPGPERLDEAVGENKKKRGPNFARFTARNLAGPRRVSSERHTGGGDHPPVASTRRAMREKPIAIMRGAPGRDAHLGDAQLSGLPDQNVREVQVAGGPIRAGPPARGELLNDFRTYFIARSANTSTAMHYDIRCSREPFSLQKVYTPLQHPPRDAAPSRVQ